MNQQSIERHGSGIHRASLIQTTSWVFAVNAVLFVCVVIENWAGVLK